MSKWRCNSCGATYSDKQADGTEYLHACSPEVIEHAECDETGKVIKPEVRKPRENIRNEGRPLDVVYVDGKPYKKAPHPEERGQTILVPCDAPIISEGAGRTLIEE